MDKTRLEIGFAQRYGCIFALTLGLGGISGCSDTPPGGASDSSFNARGHGAAGGDAAGDPLPDDPLPDTGGGPNGGFTGASAGASAMPGHAGAPAVTTPALAKGQLSAWRTGPNVPVHHTNADSSEGYVCLAETGGVLYAVSAVGSDVQTWSARESADGTLADWVTGASISGAGNGSGGDYLVNDCVIANGFFYVAGAASVLNRAPIAVDGSLGSFASSKLPIRPEDYNGLAAHEGYLYLLGQQDPTVAGVGAYALIGDDGSLRWTVGPAFSAGGAGNNPLLITDDGYAYILGGAFDGSFTGKTFFSQLAANGSFGTWNDSTSLPDPGGEGYRNGCAVYDRGYVFLLDGSRNEDPSVFVSQVHADGILSNWGTTSPIPPPGSLQAAGCAIGQNRYVYLAGGLDQSTDQAVNTLYFAKLL